MWTPEAYFDFVKSSFEKMGDPEVAQGQVRYMRDQFEFFGMKAPVWYPFSKKLIKEKGALMGDDLKKFVRMCYEDDHREMQFFGIEMVQAGLKNQPAEFADFLEELISTKSWWDTVDWLAKLVGIHFKNHPEIIRPVTERWMQSGNIWLQRSCMIFQLLYHEKTDAALLFEYVRRLRFSNEFFIQKGAGWALRQYSKQNPAAVIDFVSNTELAPLTKREALKWLKNQDKI